jgi:GTPase Era involved in 16S rRNA processing
MENDVKIQRHSTSLHRSYTTEEINKKILQTQNHTDLLVFYIDYIRNYKELTEEMMENIKKFNDDSKMLLIIEYNIVIKAVNSLLG